MGVFLWASSEAFECTHNVGMHVARSCSVHVVSADYIIYPDLRYRDTSLVRECLLGPYSRAMSRALWCSYGGVLFLMSEVPLYFKS